MEILIYIKLSELLGQIFLNSMTLTLLFYVAATVDGFHTKFLFTTSSVLMLLYLISIKMVLQETECV